MFSHDGQIVVNGVWALKQKRFLLNPSRQRKGSSFRFPSKRWKKNCATLLPEIWQTGTQRFPPYWVWNLLLMNLPGTDTDFLNSRTSFCALKLCPLIRNSRRLRLKLPNCRLALHKALCYLIACNVPAKIQYRPAADQRAHVCVLKLFWLNLQLLSQEGGELAIRSAASANLGKRWVVWACKNQPLCSSFVHLFVTRVVCLNVAVFKS